MNRFEKLDYLLETCSPNFIKECEFLDEMVRWMPKNEFNDFFEHVCSCWTIKNPEDEEDEMNEFTVEEDEMVFSA